MRQVLFHIPLDRPWSLGPFGQVPGFGLGVVLLVWVLLGVWESLDRRRESDRKFDADDAWSLARWLIGAAVIVFGAPMLGAYFRVHGSPHFRDGLPLFGYGFMLFLGMASALGLAIWRAKREGVSTDLIWDMAFCLFLGGIAGGRLFYLVQKREEVFANVQDGWGLLNAVFNLSQGGLVLYGALLAGAAVFFTYCHYRRVSPLGMADIITPSIFVGIGFGRIGCFLNGCCYGDECSLPWAVQFPAGSAAFEALRFKQLIPLDALWTPPLHPTQLYSALDGFLIAALTFWYFRHRRRNGECLAVALMIYPVTRFVIEILRNDEGGQLGTSLTISQWVSIVLLVVNVGYMAWLSQRPAVRDPIQVPELAPATSPRTPERLVRSSA